MNFINQLLSQIWGIVAALLAFGFLIMVHELGHLVAAKKSGVKVNEFWIGMGPALWKHPHGETVYYLRLLPIGGACVMEGEDGEAISERSFGKASRPRRAIILLAGVLMNFITGFAILALLPIPSGQVVTRQLEGFYEGFAFEGEDGLMAGDEILKIDGYHIFQRSDIDMAIMENRADGKFTITVRRNGEKVTIEDLPMQPNVPLEDGRTGYGLRFAIEDATFGVRLREAFYTALNDGRLVWHSLGQLLSGSVGVDQLSGPIGVTEVMATTAQSSLWQFAYLVAFISINLGVMNLLPIPGLDGGRLLFLLVEAIRRRPLSPKWEGYVNLAGLMLLFALMIYVSGNDVMRLLN